MAGRVNVSPDNKKLESQSPQNDLWFHEVTNRMNVYSGAADPTANDIPKGQWVFWRNTTTGVTSIWANWNGTVSNLSGVVPTSLAATGNITTSGGVIGYATGAGGTVTQLTSKSTAVTLNKPTGEITMSGASLSQNTTVTFVLNNSFISAATDQIICTHHATGAFGTYIINARATGAGTASIAVRNMGTGPLSEALVLKFSIIKSVNT